MAGIGFQIRHLMRNHSFCGIIGSYVYAGMLSSGPWVMSIVGIWLIGALNPELPETSAGISRFQVSVTYLMAFSLMLTSPLHLVLARFVADRLFEGREGEIVPNLTGALILTVIASGLFGLGVIPRFQGGSWAYRALMMEGFVLLCCTWIGMILLSSLKAYRLILAAFLAGYGTAVGLALQLRQAGVEGLLAGFVMGQALILFILLAACVRAFPADRFMAFGFLDRRRIYPGLAWTGLFFNLGMWIDKLLFWFNPHTSEEILAPLRASRLYDLPIFLAYLSILPAMASFLVRMETDFAEKHGAFFRAVNGGDSLAAIHQAKDEMILALRSGIWEIVKIQGLTVVVLLIYAEELLERFGISPVYRFLFSVDLFGVAIQVLFLAVLNVLFYLDRRRNALQLTLLLVVLNGAFTLLSQWGGPQFYGFGFGLAITVVTLTGFVLLGRRLQGLEYETFMLRPLET